MQIESLVTLVRMWQEAVNSRDVARLVELSDPDIEVVGPRGSARGRQVLRDWLGRAGLHLETLRVFASGDVVVVAQQAVWRSVETGEVVGEGAIASCFRVAGGRVARFARHDSLEAALADAGLDYSDEAATPGAVR
jgi:ketosteroid isomerase-like protein